MLCEAFLTSSVIHDFGIWGKNQNWTRKCKVWTIQQIVCILQITENPPAILCLLQITENPPTGRNHLKLKMATWNEIHVISAGGKWTESIWMKRARNLCSGGQTGLSTVQVGSWIQIVCPTCQTWLLVMPRWITNGRLRESTRKEIDPDVNLWRGGLTLSWRCRLAESLSCWWRSPPQLPAPPPFRTPACRTSSWMLNPRTSVTISSFCPSFVSRLVWALLFSNSCKRSWFGQEVFGNFFPRQNDGRADRK